MEALSSGQWMNHQCSAFKNKRKNSIPLGLYNKVYHRVMAAYSIDTNGALKHVLTLCTGD